MALVLDGSLGVTFPVTAGSASAVQASLHSKFDYKDGNLYWKAKTKGIQVGDRAGCINKDGYVIVGLDGKKQMAHRIVFCMQYGYMPEFIDHINGDKTDNRIENLRECTRAENAKNAKLRKGSFSGLKNVRWRKAENKWCVSMRIHGKEKHLGYYHDIELADLVATEARDKYFGKFANHGVQA